ncbi:MAG: xanthine dehydrogenase accessory protein XdhC [Paracoccaceae bacterium]
MRLHLARVAGSSPREAGACMYVGAQGQLGTIGGGQLEYMALDQARALLASGQASASMDVPLGPEIGQCCGGRVQVDLVRMADLPSELAKLEAARQTYPHVLVFGAGHIGRALVRALRPLPCTPRLIDSRAEELALAADFPQTLTPLPEAELRAAPAGSAYIILTHDHALDFLLGAEALARTDAAYCGMIGSATKAARFARYCRDQGLDPTPLRCPMGLKTASKEPSVIAAMIVAELWPALETVPARALT